MVDSYNIGNALLIIGVIYLHLVYGLDIIVTVLLVLLGAVTWAYAGFTNERKEYFKAYIEMLKAKAEYYRKKASI
jgi:hypothetical protein